MPCDPHVLSGTNMSPMHARCSRSTACVPTTQVMHMFTGSDRFDLEIVVPAGYLPSEKDVPFSVPADDVTLYCERPALAPEPCMAKPFRLALPPKLTSCFVPTCVFPCQESLQLWPTSWIATCWTTQCVMPHMYVLPVTLCACCRPHLQLLLGGERHLPPLQWRPLPEVSPLSVCPAALHAIGLLRHFQ